MADTVTLDSGSGGAVIATQDEGGIHYQEVKLTASGTGTTEDLSKAEDTTHTSGEHGIMTLAVRNDVLAALAGTDGDYTPIQANDIGALFVTGEHVEDAAHASGDYGHLVLAVRNDVLAALGGTDGDYASFQVNDIGALFVTGEHVEDVAHVTGDYGHFVLAVRNDTLAALATTDGDYAPFQANASGAIYIQEGAAMDVSAATVTVDLGANNDVTIDSSSIVKAEDAGHSSGDDGVMALAVRNDTLSALAGTDVDYAPFQVNDIGALFVTGEHVEDVAHVTADYGHFVLAVRNDALAALAGTDGDYSGLQVSAIGGLWSHISALNVGGSKLFTSVDLDESEEEIANSACTVYSMFFWNATAAPLWAQVFNIAAASVTVGTTAPTYNFIIPANADSDGSGVQISLPVAGVAFSTALTVAITTGVGTNNGAPGANDGGCVIAYQD